MESISIKEWHGAAKVLGCLFCFSGALVFAFVKGPSINFKSKYLRNQSEVTIPSLIKSHSKGEWVKGSLTMLSANTTWSLWLVMQVGHLDPIEIFKKSLYKMNIFCLSVFVYFSCSSPLY